MEKTSDGSMVRVDMTDEGFAQSEPSGRFIDLNQALVLEAQGVCRIRRLVGRNSAGYEMTSEGKVLVEYLERSLVKSYGRYGSYDEKHAELGEKAGKWKICRDGGEGFETKMMVPELRLSLTKELVGNQVYETKGVKRRNVSWVMDNFIEGGAEISSKLVIGIGRDCGFRVDVLTPSCSSDVMAKILGESELIVINNIWGFSKGQLWAVMKAIYSDRIPYVKYEHDHRELDRPAFSRKLFRNSKLNVFISPAHLKNHQAALGCEGIVLPLAIDVDLFKPIEGVERKKDTAAVLNVRNFKLWSNLQKYINAHPGIQFTVMAKDPVVRGPNVVTHEKVPYEKMPELYSGFEYVVHLLDGWGAGERVVLEGALCGCKVVANERVGHMSWERDLMDVEGLRSWLRTAPYEFWKEIERKVLC